MAEQQQQQMQPPNVPSAPLVLGSPHELSQHHAAIPPLPAGVSQGILQSLPPGVLPSGVPGVPVSVPMLPGQTPHIPGVSIPHTTSPQGGASAAAAAAAASRRPANSPLTLGELYLLTKPATWESGDPSAQPPPHHLDPNAPPIPVEDAIPDASASISAPSGGGRAVGPRRTQRGGKRAHPYPSEEQVEDDEEEDGAGDEDYALHPAAGVGELPVTPNGKKGKAASAGSAPRPRFKCSYPSCEKSFTREGDRVRHMSTTLHRGETLSSQRIAEIMAETRETHRQYCIRCKRIMLRINSRRRHEENPQACGSRRGMPKDVIEAGRVRDDEYLGVPEDGTAPQFVAVPMTVPEDGVLPVMPQIPVDAPSEVILPTSGPNDAYVFLVSFSVRDSSDVLSQTPWTPSMMVA
jgi:hypothetical protein